jgi:hypothetical protein
MPLADWIHKYPQVQALMQQPEDALAYDADGDDGLPTDLDMTRPEDLVRAFAWMAAHGYVYTLEADGETPRCEYDYTTWQTWGKTHGTTLAHTGIGPRSVTTYFKSLTWPRQEEAYHWQTTVRDTTSATVYVRVIAEYRTRAAALRWHAMISAVIMEGLPLERGVLEIREALEPALAAG